MKQISIRFYLHKSSYSQSRKDYRLYFRVSYGGQRWDCKTIHRMKKKDWDLKGQRSKSNDRVNRDILQIAQRLYEIHDQFYYQRKVITLTAIKAEFMGDGKHIPLIGYMENHLAFLESSSDCAGNTLKSWKGITKRLIQFLKDRGLKGITLQEIDGAFLQKMDEWLCQQKSQQTKKLYERGYVNQFHKKLRAVLNKAIREGIININPYQRWRIPPEYSETKIQYLTSDELESVYKSELGGNVSLQRVRDIFVFSCMTGLRFSDASSLRLEEIELDKATGLYFIQKVQQKTKHPVTIPLLKWAEKIYHKYKDSDSAEITGRLLPIYSNVKVNAYLKDIARLSGVDKELTHHMARHTCGTMLISNGIPVEQVKEIMGHKKIETTMIYAKITKQSLVNTALKINKLL